MDNKPQTSPNIDEQQRPLIIESKALFGDTRKIEIKHQDKIYQLTITRQNKLILTR